MCCSRFHRGLTAPVGLARGAHSPTSVYWSSRTVHSGPNCILSPSLLNSEIVASSLNWRLFTLITRSSLLHDLRLRGRIRSSARARRLGRTRWAQVALGLGASSLPAVVLLLLSSLAAWIHSHFLELRSHFRSVLFLFFLLGELLFVINFSSLH